MAKIMVTDEHSGHLDCTLDKFVNIDEYEQVKTNNMSWPVASPGRGLGR